MTSISNLHQNVKHFDKNNNDKNKNASYTSTTNVDNAVTNVTECLTDHQKCTGRYVDSLSGGFTITCSCKCHRNQKDG